MGQRVDLMSACYQGDPRSNVYALPNGNFCVTAYDENVMANPSILAY